MQPATSLDFSYLKITSHSPFAEKYRRGLERKNSPTHYFTCRVSRVSRVSLGVFGCQGVNFSSPPQKILRLFTKCGVVVNWCSGKNCITCCILKLHQHYHEFHLKVERGGSISLLAPKVLLDYLRPMITIHPTIIHHEFYLTVERIYKFKHCQRHNGPEDSVLLNT